MCCHANNDTIIGHLKAHVFNETSLSVVKDAFKDSEVKDNIRDVDTVSSLKDDTSENQLSGGQEDSLNALTNENLCIKGYLAHRCLLPGEYHNVNSKSKDIRGLTQKEVLILVEALKAGTMHVQSPTLITSEFPIITGEVPPSDYFHSGARQMFTNHHTDYNGPSWMKISAATTKIKKTGDTRKMSSTSQQQELQADTTEHLQSKPPSTCPFVVVPQPVPAAAIKFPTSKSGIEPHKIIPETEFEDAAHGEKRKVAASRLP
ncbi:hypothetical protein EDB19DRAFT_1947348 [Suillus lakei]|nr:hypothetical protein EDB19DRAFT_1947348 [Suillus lakei]